MRQRWPVRQRCGAVAMVVALSVPLLSGCGGDDAAPPSTASEAPTPETPASEAPGEGESSPGEATGGDDLIGDVLSRYGLSSEILSFEDRDCMNAELASVFPDGVPDDFAVSPEFQEELDAVDAAADACDVQL